MNTFGRVIMWLALALIVLLIILSVYSAFIGTERAKALFNSAPMQITWFTITSALIISLILFPSLFKQPPLLLIHLGCIGILVGSIQASQTGHKIQKRLFGIDKIRSGVIVINKGKMNDEVVVPAKSRFIAVELPFHIGLKDYRVEYYDSPGADGRQAVRDYLSDISIIHDGKVVKRKTIEVNRPLHYGGYYFYLRPTVESDDEQVVLAVVSDNGLIAVFIGYVFLAAGLFWQCWLKPMMKEK